MSKRPPASLGRRLLPAIAMTTAASGLVALLDRPSSGAAINLGGSAAAGLPRLGQTDTTTAVDPPAVSSTLPAASGQPTPVPSLTPVAPTPQQQQQPQPAAAQQPVATQPKAASGACQGKAVDGPTVDTRWGPVQVEAIVSTSGQICDVDAIQYPSDHRRSLQINRQALPILHTQVMKAQSANINGVSGATITSSGYVRSLQALLDSHG
ncbi:MAG: FMN-binding protein [Ilumatobacteraceae bacterium]